MTKPELRKARKAAVAANLPLTGELAIDRNNQSNVEFSSERLPNGRINLKRERALERYARYVYENECD